MKPIRSRLTQDLFGGDLPYYYARDNNGVFFGVVWKLSLLERLKVLLLGKITTKTYRKLTPLAVVVGGE